MQEREPQIIIEFYRVGNAVKVSAVDPVTMIEACIVGDPSRGEAALTRAAIQKLCYVMARQEGKSSRP